MSKKHVRRRSHSLSHREEDSPLGQFLLKAVDVGLAGCIFAVPLIMGGRQALGQLALIVLAVVVALAWTLRQSLSQHCSWRRSGAELLLLGGVLLILLQLAPLPVSIRQTLAPQTVRLLPLWNAVGPASGNLDVWDCITLTPGETQNGLAIFLAYALVFLVTVQRINAVSDVERLMRWIALSALAMASFGLLQLLTSNGKFFWFYEHPFTDTYNMAKGSFTNRNHFAHFLALGIGPLIWWMQHQHSHRKSSGEQRFGPSDDWNSLTQTMGMKGLAVGVVLFAGLLSLSRAGMLAMGLGVVIVLAVCFRTKALGIRSVAMLAGVSVLLAALLMINGFDRVSDRLDKISSGSVEEMDHGAGRRTIWATVCRAIPDFPILGAGVGSHSAVYPVYLERSLEMEYTHAESGPLQTLLETGVTGATLIAIGILFCAYWCLRGLRASDSKRITLCLGAIASALAVNVMHATTDFVWYVPGCMVLVAILAASACRLWQITHEQKGVAAPQWQTHRLVPVGVTALVVVAGGWMVLNRAGATVAEPHWDRYRMMSLASKQPETTSDDAEEVGLLDEEPADTSLEEVSRMIDELEEVVRWDPQRARPHFRLAAAYLRRFELTQAISDNAMPLTQIRDAAIVARNKSTPEEVDQWLTHALGERRGYLDAALEHTRKGLRLCPLAGEGYLYLAQLCFLTSAGDDQNKQAFIDQALRVRPRDGAVLLEAGREAWMAGDCQRGLEFWQKAFQVSREQQCQLCNLLAGRVSVAFILERFQPDLIGIRALEAAYRRLGEDQHAPELLTLFNELCRTHGLPPSDYHAARAWLDYELTEVRRVHGQLAVVEAQAMSGDEAADVWLEAGWVYQHLGESARWLQCANNAYQCDPNSYRIQYSLAKALAANGQFDQAEDHLRWCQQRRPDNPKLETVMREVVKQRIDQQSRTAASSSIPGEFPW